MSDEVHHCHEDDQVTEPGHVLEHRLSVRPPISSMLVPRLGFRHVRTNEQGEERWESADEERTHTAPRASCSCRGSTRSDAAGQNMVQASSLFGVTLYAEPGVRPSGDLNSL